MTEQQEIPYLFLILHEGENCHPPHGTLANPDDPKNVWYEEIYVKRAVLIKAKDYKEAEAKFKKLTGRKNLRNVEMYFGKDMIQQVSVVLLKGLCRILRGEDIPDP